MKVCFCRAVIVSFRFLKEEKDSSLEEPQGLYKMQLLISDNTRNDNKVLKIKSEESDTQVVFV